MLTNIIKIDINLKSFIHIYDKHFLYKFTFKTYKRLKIYCFQNDNNKISSENIIILNTKTENLLNAKHSNCQNNKKKSATIELSSEKLRAF